MTDEIDRLRALALRIEAWSSADMWRLNAGPSTDRASMRLQARIINEEVRQCLRLPALPASHWHKDAR